MRAIPDPVQYEIVKQIVSPDFKDEKKKSRKGKKRGKTTRRNKSVISSPAKRVRVMSPKSPIEEKTVKISKKKVVKITT